MKQELELSYEMEPGFQGPPHLSLEDQINQLHQQVKILLAENEAMKFVITRYRKDLNGLTERIAKYQGVQPKDLNNTDNDIVVLHLSKELGGCRRVI